LEREKKEKPEKSIGRPGGEKRTHRAADERFGKREKNKERLRSNGKPKNQRSRSGINSFKGRRGGSHGLVDSKKKVKRERTAGKMGKPVKGGEGDFRLWRLP